MPTASTYQVIIIGGSYAGLSAAMALGRARCRVLVLDGGLPRNRFTPHAHNLLLHDGDAPADLAAKARAQVAHYPTVTQLAALATTATRLTDDAFEISTADHGTFQARYLLLATGLRDELPELPGFAECWGKSVIHCPYCHGYEVADQPTGVLVNGEIADHMVPLLLNWAADLTVFTDGPAQLADDIRRLMSTRGVALEETPLAALHHQHGQLSALELADGRRLPLPVLYARLPWQQASDLPAQLGCAIDEQQLLVIDKQQQTSVPGVYAAGDNTTMPAQLVQAMAAGNMAGAAISRALIFSGLGH